MTAPASAQNDQCAEGAKLMQARQSMVQSITNRPKNRKLNPIEACSKFGSLVSNGNQLIAWMEKSGAWCNVPDGIIANVKGDQEKAVNIRGQACGAAAKYRQALAAHNRARAQAAQAARQGGGGGMLGGRGGDIVSGQMRVPSGAL
ncbi:MAG: hypothetical protein ACRCTD_10955 [Beijerinckiaceae bacterium]